MINSINARFLRYFIVLSLLMTLTGCFYWLRAYQTYLQMSDFDEHFFIGVTDVFTLHFKDPILLSEDLVSLAKLRPSEEINTSSGAQWIYRFRKAGKEGDIVVPEVQFSLILTINRQDEVIALSFSSIFLQIAQPEFLELSIRSVGSGEIDRGNRQLKVSTEKVGEVEVQLPLKPAVLDNLGDPFEIVEDETHEVTVYYFMLEAHGIKKGYEDRALSAIRLTFDKAAQEMIEMSGRFAGLNVPIDYRQYQAPY